MEYVSWNFNFVWNYSILCVSPEFLTKVLIYSRERWKPSVLPLREFFGEIDTEPVRPTRDSKFFDFELIKWTKLFFSQYQYEDSLSKTGQKSLCEMILRTYRKSDQIFLKKDIIWFRLYPWNTSWSLIRTPNNYSRTLSLPSVADYLFKSRWSKKF